MIDPPLPIVFQLPQWRRARVIGVVAIVLASMIGIGGCSWFGPTPQQQFIEALNRGDGPRANEIWNKMSAKDRLRWHRGQGITPAVSPKEAAKILSEMPPEEAQGEITINPNLGGSLLDLPKLGTPQPAAQSSATPPDRQGAPSFATPPDQP